MGSVVEEDLHNLGYQLKPSKRKYQLPPKKQQKKKNKTKKKTITVSPSFLLHALNV